MRVLLINTSERIGGAAVACSRLLEALTNCGVKAKMLVRDKQSDSLSVVTVGSKWHMKLCFLWERFTIWAANRFSRKNLFAVDIANAGTDVTRLPEFREADVIHLHWVNQGFLSLKQLEKILASGKRVVWTMHDMWPSTAICHHARQCTRYRELCHHCPYLQGGGSATDLSYHTFLRKQQMFRGHRVSLVACSHWLEGLAKQSALLKEQHITSIPNPLNTRLFKPNNPDEARTRLQLPLEKRLILFGSVKITDKRKGIDYLIEACRLLAENHPQLREQLGVVVFGNGSEQLAALLPFPVYAVGYLSEEARLVDVYNAVDLFVTPSLEENLPNTIMEAMACGTPCVGFQIGGIPEMIDHGENGYVAEYKSSEDFARGIHTLLSAPNYSELCRQAVRKVVTHYSEDAVARRYIQLYAQGSLQT
ncbi:MAG: glycosyltransferase family 4 protein [Bacteroides sp.]|nr:glycosyltransferase family 4 protein [Bacteroides sp.]